MVTVRAGLLLEDFVIAFFFNVSQAARHSFDHRRTMCPDAYAFHAEKKISPSHLPLGTISFEKSSPVRAIS